MANVFDKIGDIKNNVNRSAFDWSHANNFTTGIGRITPIFCEQIPPNSSLKIRPDYGLQFMPMMFPIQTRLKAVMSFYKIPLRTLWKDYMNWISSPNNTEQSDYEPPYLRGSEVQYFGKNGLLKVSGLADYLGVPVTVVLPSPSGELPNNMGFDPKAYFISGSANTPLKLGEILGTSSFVAPTDNNDAYNGDDSYPKGYNGILVATVGTSADKHKRLGMTAHFTLNGSAAAIIQYKLVTAIKGEDAPLFAVAVTDNLTNELTYIAYIRKSQLNIDSSSLSFSVDLTANGQSHIYLLAPLWQVNWNSNGTMLFDKYLSIAAGGSFEIDAATCPYAGTWNTADNNVIKLSAYPFRAYEAVYNAYIRNIKNNPFKKNGKPVYNEWITNSNGGDDATSYQLYHANWFSDMFTTALPSPQQGKAPLVGLTTYESTRMLENGHTVSTLNFAVVDEDGTKHKVEFESNGEALKNVTYTEMSQDTEVKPYSLIDVVTSGISINDFRNVNAYQRYLELNQFRGFSYKDIIEGRFDVNVRYDSLQMPEYLGGSTREINMNAVTQTVETSNSGSYAGALGSQSGVASLRSGSDSINVFCDEECIVLGLMYIVPMPVYSQHLPKHFTYRDRLDSFNPEFDHIGYQPIYNQELAPIQQYLSDPTKMKNVFGYQRPWYEYVQKLDTAHGIFRTELRNFLMHRTFDAVPQLGEAFTTVHEEDVNDVFSVTETTDKIFGQVYFDCVAKLPISRVVVPKLE